MSAIAVIAAMAMAGAAGVMVGRWSAQRSQAESDARLRSEIARIGRMVIEEMRP